MFVAIIMKFVAVESHEIYDQTSHTKFLVVVMCLVRNICNMSAGHYSVLYDMNAIIVTAVVTFVCCC